MASQLKEFSRKRVRVGAWAIGLAILFVATPTLVYYFCPKPELKSYTSYSKAFLSEKGELLRLTLAADDRYRIYQTIDGVSAKAINATILYEDKYFYQNSGVDFSALLRAFWQTYVKRERRIGASTLTMQTARLRWRISSATLSGKFEQIFRAMQLARHYSKKEILEAYFNLAPYGQNIEGIAAASLIYFNKTPDRLTFPEALTLSVIPQNPNKRNPSTDTGYKNMVAARDRLFHRWISKYPEDTSNALFLDLPLTARALNRMPFEAPHFIQFQNAKLSQWQTGAIHTTLNLNLQHILEQQIRDYTDKRKDAGIHNASALLINYQTHEIKAMVGSADFFNKKISGQVNGTLAKRSPGSALKPFVYAMAMDEGVIHPMTMLRDAQKRFGGFTPENYDRKFLGPVFAKNALIQSRNVPAVDLQARLRSRSFHDFLNSAGVKNLKPAEHYGLALALGGGEVTMLELATIYSALANGGRLHTIKSSSLDKVSQAKQLLSPEASFLTLDILRNNPPPHSEVSHFDSSYKNDIAWKTGTSWAFRDAWAVGVSGPYVLAVWVGNFDGHGNNAFIGRSAAGPLLFSMLHSIFPDQSWTLEHASNTALLNIEKVDVCEKTGDLPGKYCPRTIPSWFIPGVSPIKVSTVHRAIPITNDTGLRGCGISTEETHLEVYEFWPSDFLTLFQQAGLSLKTPPPYSPECELNDKRIGGQEPVISSPSPTVEYALQSNNNNSRTIPFTATVDTDVEKVHWFVGQDYAGSSKRGLPFYWKARTGSFLITAVDDLGRADSVNINVGLVF